MVLNNVSASFRGFFGDGRKKETFYKVFKESFHSQDCFKRSIMNWKSGTGAVNEGTEAG